MLKERENNDSQLKQLEKQETELIDKLQTTLGKVQDFKRQSNSFDNVTNSMMASINYSRKQLKPLSNHDEFKTKGGKF